MPGFDGRGPYGNGAMTGGGRGYCVRVMDGTAGFGRRFNKGRGGYGYRNRFYSGGIPGGGRVVADESLEQLKAQAILLKGEIDAIQARIRELAGEQ